MKLPSFVIDRMFRLARAWSNDELRKVAPVFGGRIVNVSAWKDSDKQGDTYKQYFSGAESYHITNYSGDAGFQGIDDEIFLDLTGELPDELKGAFDVVFNHTTLEHIFDVNKAFENICAMSNDVVVIVLPFAQVQHESGTWQDFWRFTPSWVRTAFDRQGFEVMYLTSNNQRNAAVYVFAVASRNPDKWRGKLPEASHAGMAAGWLGRSRWRNAVNAVVNKIVPSSK